MKRKNFLFKKNVISSWKDAQQAELALKELREDDEEEDAMKVTFRRL